MCRPHTCSGNKIPKARSKRLLAAYNKHLEAAKGAVINIAWWGAQTFTHAKLKVFILFNLLNSTNSNGTFKSEMHQVEVFPIHLNKDPHCCFLHTMADQVINDGFRMHGSWGWWKGVKSHLFPNELGWIFWASRLKCMHQQWQKQNGTSMHFRYVNENDYSTAVFIFQNNVPTLNGAKISLEFGKN